MSKHGTRYRNEDTSFHPCFSNTLNPVEIFLSNAYYVLVFMEDALYIIYKKKKVKLETAVL